MGVCRADHGCREKGEYASAATGNITSDRRGPLVPWTYVKRVTMSHKTWLPVP